MKDKKRARLIWVLLLIGFCAMEFPGVLFFGSRAKPFLFGMPFIYGYILCWWAYMCLVFFLAYRLNWGRSKPDQRGFMEVSDD